MEVTVPVVVNIDFIKINNLIERAMKNIGNAIRNTFIRMNKNDKELMKLVNMRKRVKTKRLKKKYDKKINKYISDKIKKNKSK